jgi:L-threonylcarbamoyladenylate synthase
LAPEQEAAMDAAVASHAHEPWYPDAKAALETEQAGAFATDEELGELAMRELPFYFASFGDTARAYLDTLRADTPNADTLRFFNQEIFETFDLRPELEKITAATLVVTGSEDFITGPPSAAEIEQGIADVVKVVIPGAGHFIFVEAPEAFGEAVVSFLGVPSAALIERAVAAIRAGKPVVLPTDTVYGLCADPSREAPAREVARLKVREERQPTALLARDVELLFESVPELRDQFAAPIRALLPGPFTLILPNPERRYPWLTGDSPETIGVRVPKLEGPAAEVLGRVGTVLATSANLHGGPDPRRLDEVPEEIRRGSAALIDGGELPGIPSTVLDLTGPEPRVVREGAVPAAEALERLLAATSGG